ncbi:MAG: NUDIX domain-containing protein [Candidatus Woesearchaeota archaeon]|jgi:ADP-ribose pyrophosphatase YjhB (NUDIX family)
MGVDSIFKGNKKKIFELFLEKSRLKFSDIEKKLNIRSNMIAYHIESLKKEGIIKKEKEFWKLTKEYEKMIPFHSNISNMELGCNGVVLVIVTNKNKILLIKREKKPYKGYWSIFGRKLRIPESIKDASINCIKHEAELDVKFNKICGVLHERLKENEEYKHAFIFILTKAETKTIDIPIKNKEHLKWFEIKKLKKEKIIPSDLFMIEKFIKRKTKVHSIIMEEKDDELISFNSY